MHIVSGGNRFFIVVIRKATGLAPQRQNVIIPNPTNLLTYAAIECKLTLDEPANHKAVETAQVWRMKLSRFKTFPKELAVLTHYQNVGLAYFDNYSYYMGEIAKFGQGSVVMKKHTYDRQRILARLTTSKNWVKQHLKKGEADAKYIVGLD